MYPCADGAKEIPGRLCRTAAAAETADAVLAVAGLGVAGLLAPSLAGAPVAAVAVTAAVVPAAGLLWAMSKTCAQIIL